jgi:hypothetical protein
MSGVQKSLKASLQAQVSCFDFIRMTSAVKPFACPDAGRPVLPL